MLHSNKKKICFITYDFPTNPKGGGEIYLSNVLKGINKNQFDITVLTVEEFQQNRVDIYNSQITQTSNHSVRHYDDMEIQHFNISGINRADFKARDFHKEKYSIFYDDLKELNKCFFGYGVVNVMQKQNKFSYIVEHEFLIHFEKKKKYKVNIIDLKSQLNVEITNTINKEKCEVEISSHLDSALFLETDGSNNIKRFSLKNTDNYDTLYRIEISCFYENEWINVFLKNYEGYVPIKTYIENWQKKHFSILNYRNPKSKELTQWLEANHWTFDSFVIHGCTFLSNYECAKILKKKNRKYTIIPHFHLEDKFYFDFGIYYMLINAENIFLFNQDQKNLFSKKGLINTIQISGGGINFEPLSNLNEKIETPVISTNNDDKYVLFVGRNSENKQLKKITQFFSNLNLSGITLAICSPDNLEEFESMPNVRLLGFVEEKKLKEIYRNAICTINIGLSESFGMTVVESYLYGTPVIGWLHTSSLRDLIIHGKTGFLISKIEEIRPCLIKILSEKNELFNAFELNELSKKYDWKNLSAVLEQHLG